MTRQVDAIKNIDRILQPQTTEFWGEVCSFQPALLDKAYGNGKRILQVFPINERPRYWVVRVDSSCVNDDEVFEILDDIYDAIDEQFGTPDEDDLGVGDDRPYFPMFDSQGVAWHFAGIASKLTT